MQVQAKDASNKNYGMFMTISAQRPKASDNAELRFLETPAGQPAAVKTWWYPGNTIGREFIYPRTQARRLAQATNQTVLTTKADNVATRSDADCRSRLRVAHRPGYAADRRTAGRCRSKYASRRREQRRDGDVGRGARRHHGAQPACRRRARRSRELG